VPILINQSSRVICQGALDEEEVFHIHQCKLYGTQVVAWVKAGEGGKEKLGLPVFDSVREARKQTSATVSLIFVDPPFVTDAVFEAVEGGIETIICLTEGVPLHEMARIRFILAKKAKCRLIGPSSCGIITPSQCKAGVMPGYVFAQGSVGIISSVDTLGYEAAWQITNVGLGQSTFVGLGDSQIKGTPVEDLLGEFDHDARTEAVLMIFKNNETGMEAIAEWVKQRARKPHLAVIAGHMIPPKEGVLLGNDLSYMKNSLDLLRNAGVRVIEDIGTIGFAVEQAITQSRLKEFT
jgi:succinyl-CoA synthetase alpha subunit